MGASWTACAHAVVPDCVEVTLARVPITEEEEQEQQQMQQMQQMPSPSDKDIEQFSQIAAPVPILPPGTGDYEMREDPNIATTPPVRDAYYGGGIPGPSFVPTGGQTAPDFRGYAGGGYVGRGMRHGGIMSIGRR